MCFLNCVCVFYIYILGFILEHFERTLCFFSSLLLDRASATSWSFRHFLELLLGPSIRWRKFLDPPSAKPTAPGLHCLVLILVLRHPHCVPCRLLGQCEIGAIVHTRWPNQQWCCWRAGKATIQTKGRTIRIQTIFSTGNWKIWFLSQNDRLGQIITFGSRVFLNSDKVSEFRKSDLDKCRTIMRTKQRSPGAIALVAQPIGTNLELLQYLL